jgi:aconitate hydratase 2/2-methylisocitrate dehydratase
LQAQSLSKLKIQPTNTELILLNFSSYNTLPGTTSAAGVKAKFLKEIILVNL